MTVSSGLSTSYSAPFHTTRSHGSFADQEPSLWRAVITQALMDAATASAKPDARRVRSDAVQWLLGNSEDFEYVCDNAGLDPDYVRSRARVALQRNCTWRLPVGQGWRARAKMALTAATVCTNGVEA